jgi:glutamate--cysteine ligase
VAACELELAAFARPSPAQKGGDVTTTWQNTRTPAPTTVLRTTDDVEAYVARICFKTGPPRLVGAELEWTVHHRADPRRPLDPAGLAAALSPYTPTSLDPRSPHLRLPRGSVLTVEPGGQVEISTPPYASLAGLRAATAEDLDHLTDRLSHAGLVLGSTGIDPHRPPRRLLHGPRYDAMTHAFARQGPAGLAMMCGTAGAQVCLDVGEPERVAARWRALHDLGPVLLASFANSPHARYPGWASARMATWFGVDPARTAPVSETGEPATAFARYALRAPLLCVRDGPDGPSGRDGPGGPDGRDGRDGPGGSWRAPPDVTFADWLAGAIPRRPTAADLDLHLSTLFPPVRPRGYLEVRYLDAQPPDGWFGPVAVLAALLTDDRTVDRVRELCAPVAGAWRAAARSGLADPTVRRAAYQVLDLACRELHRTDLNPWQRDQVSEELSRRLAGAPGGTP